MLTYCSIQWNGNELYNYILAEKCTVHTMRIRKNNPGTSYIKLAFELIIIADYSLMIIHTVSNEMLINLQSTFCSGLATTEYT